MMILNIAQQQKIPSQIAKNEIVISGIATSIIMESIAVDNLAPRMLSCVKICDVQKFHPQYQ